jgi:hypothetical protein
MPQIVFRVQPLEIAAREAALSIAVFTEEDSKT